MEETRWVVGGDCFGPTSFSKLRGEIDAILNSEDRFRCTLQPPVMMNAQPRTRQQLIGYTNMQAIQRYIYRKELTHRRRHQANPRT